MPCLRRVVPNHFNWKGFRFSLVFVLAVSASARSYDGSVGSLPASAYNLVASPRRNQAALRAQQLAFGAHQPKNVESLRPIGDRFHTMFPYPNCQT
jgi:hypothetical protein